MKKIVLLLLSIIYAFAINLQTASKDELMSIKGIGKKRAEAIIRYRKTHKITKAEDLLAIKGIGKNIITNIKKDVKNKKRIAKNTTKSKNLKKKKIADKTKTKKENLKSKKTKTKKQAKKDTKIKKKKKKKKSKKNK